MQKNLSQLNILAPAGSAEQLLAAVNNGCDAIYLGLDGFNARMKAPNFNSDNLSEYVDFCHLFGVKVYVAINTSIKNNEFSDALQLLKEAYLRKADGVIVTDLALMKIAGSLPKPFEVVASTQLNVHDKYGAEFVKKHGATTVVCARECSLDQVREIRSTGIKVECFLHGAMCVCQSGQCLFSSMVGGNSGNRGLCAQPCRKFYFAEGDAATSGYLLSARDMCGLDTASDLVKAGATTFKIEGRNRRAEYAGIAAKVYRQLFDNGFVAGKEDYASLAEMFNRGMASNRYLVGRNDDIILPAAQNHTGVAVGEINNGAVVAFKELRKGDGLKVFDGDSEVCGGVALENGVGVVRTQFSGKVTDGMRVNRTTSVTLCDEILSTKRKLDVSIKFTAKPNEEPIIAAYCCGVTACIKADFVAQQAFNRATANEEIIQQLQKSGNTHYTITNIVTETDNIFIAKSQINALRRQVLDKLTECLLEEYDSKFTNRYNVDLSNDTLIGRLDLPPKAELGRTSSKNSTSCAALCYNEEQLNDAVDLADYLIYKPDFVDHSSIKTAAKYNAFLDIPSFADLNFIEKLVCEIKVGIVCNNVGQVEFARKHSLKYIAGTGLNLFNDYIVKQFDDCATFVYSRELTLKEIESFDCANGLTFVDGKIPLMQLCHCPYKVAFGGDCSACKASKTLVYRDELGNKFEINRRRVGTQCVFELFNGNKLSVTSKLNKSGRYLFDCDKAVLKHYVNINDGIADNYVENKPYTKGRLYDKIN